MLRLEDRIVEMHNYRWPEIIQEWGLKTNSESWASEIKFILHYVSLMDEKELPNKTDLELVKKKLVEIKRNKWKIDALSKEKLCIFNLINDFENPKTLVKVNLDRWE